jgi:hypothetical protein
MKIGSNWEQRPLRHRILRLCAVFLGVTIPLASLLYTYTARPLLYLDHWATLFWVALIGVFLQDLCIYGHRFRLGRISGTVTALFIAYIPFASVYETYSFLVPGNEAGLILSVLYTVSLFFIGSHIGQHIALFQRIDHWLYRVIFDELHRMLT